MWTKQTRGRMAEIARKTKRYPSDLTDEEWERIAPLMPKPARRGRRRRVDFREIINAVRYLVRSGCGWEMLPVHFGPWQTVYWWFRRLMRRFLFQTIHDLCLMCDRERVGREASPSAAVIDSQSIKAPHAKTRGYDAAKKIVGRKRHIAVDTDGRLLMVNLTPADISDSAGAQAILDAIRKRWPWVKHLFADGAYDRLQLMDKAALLDFIIEVVRRTDSEPGFKVVPRRWVVERSFGFMDYQRKYEENSLDEEQKRATREGLREDELALFDLLQKDGLDKTSRERVKQASRGLLASIKARLAELDRFWEKQQTKAEVEVFILDEVFFDT